MSFPRWGHVAPGFFRHSDAEAVRLELVRVSRSEKARANSQRQIDERRIAAEAADMAERHQRYIEENRSV